MLELLLLGENTILSHKVGSNMGCFVMFVTSVCMLSSYLPLIRLVFTSDGVGVGVIRETIQKTVD